MELCVSKGTICNIPPEQSGKAVSRALCYFRIPCNTVETARDLKQGDLDSHFSSAIVFLNPEIQFLQLETDNLRVLQKIL